MNNVAQQIAPQEICFDLQNLSARRSDQMVDTLTDISFSLYHGDNLALVGPNGAGKTTLLRVMLGLTPHYQGELWAFGQKCQQESDFVAVRRRAGLVFQDPDIQLFCPTVIEDVAFGLLNMGKSPEEAYDLSEKILAELHLSHLRDRITYRLSGGEKRLVTLATVLVMQPEVLILDEPTNALDRKSEQRLLELLQEMPQTKMFISHDPKVVDCLANRRLYMAQGRLSETEI